MSVSQRRTTTDCLSSRVMPFRWLSSDISKGANKLIFLFPPQITDLKLASGAPGQGLQSNRINPELLGLHGVGWLGRVLSLKMGISLQLGRKALRECYCSGKEGHLLGRDITRLRNEGSLSFPVFLSCLVREGVLTFMVPPFA